MSLLNPALTLSPHHHLQSLNLIINELESTKKFDGKGNQQCMHEFLQFSFFDIFMPEDRELNYDMAYDFFYDIYCSIVKIQNESDSIFVIKKDLLQICIQQLEDTNSTMSYSLLGNVETLTGDGLLKDEAYSLNGKPSIDCHQEKIDFVQTPFNQPRAVYYRRNINDKRMSQKVFVSLDQINLIVFHKGSARGGIIVC